jgi:hypothetical protein
MISRYMEFGIALAVSTCLFLPACNKEKGGVGVGVGVGVGETGTQYINLTIAPTLDNTCQQNDSTSAVPVAPGQSVTYQGGAAALREFKVVFPSAIPFSSAVIDSPHGAATSAGAAKGVSGAVYNYGSLTINNRTCSNGSSLGLIMR